MPIIINILQQISPKEVSLLLLGALISALASFFAKYLPSFIANYRKVTPLLDGPWYTYHWSRALGNPIFRCGQLNCRRRYYGVRIDITNAEGKKTAYRGRVSFEGKDILLECSGRKHSEKFHARFNDPISYGGDTKMIGLVLGVDFDREKYTAVQVCTRSPQTDEAAKQLLESVTDFALKESGLRVSRQVSKGKQETTAEATTAA